MNINNFIDKMMINNRLMTIIAKISILSTDMRIEDRVEFCKKMETIISEYETNIFDKRESNPFKQAKLPRNGERVHFIA